MTNTIGDDFPRQQERVRVIQEHAREIGPPGQFLVITCGIALKRAKEAAASGDIVEILKSYKELTEFEE